MKRKTFQRAASQKYSHPFSIFLRAALLSFLLAMGGLTFLRVLLLVKYGSALLTTTWATDLLTMLWMGGRFDAKLLATTFFLPLVLFSVPYLFSRRALPHRWMVSLWSVLQTFLFVFLWLIGVVDYYYFSFFHSHLDATAWGFLEDDTRAVLHSIGTDFPVLRIFFFTLALACGAFFCGRYWIQQPYRALRPSFLWRRLTSLFLCLACVFLLARGTVSSHPLRAIHLNISRNVLINQLTNSPLFALYDVLAHADENRLETDIPKILQRWGFRDEQEALEAYTGSSGEGEGNSLFSVCIDTTACNDSLRLLPPHVVFLQMESMGSYFLQFQKEPFNLLGALREELPYGYLFTNTLSGGSGTLVSLEGLLFGIVQGPMAQSTHFRTPLPYSVAKIFQQQGYTTHYISGQRLGWRNVNNFLAAQGFDAIEGEQELAAYVSPTAPRGTWGLHDEALFERIAQVLDSARTPQWIYGMSISHHTPYDTPLTEANRDLEIPDSLWRWIDMPEEVARKSFAAFAYQNDQLGRFIRTLRASRWGERTILVFTGDHTLKQNLKHCEDPLALYGVPIAFFIPKHLLTSDSVDTHQYASHNDIFPTLFHLALSGATYFRTGRNLFQSPQHLPEVALYDRKFLLAKGHTIPLEQYTSEGNPRQDSLFRIARGYYATMQCFLAHELHRDTALSSLFRPCPCGGDFGIETSESVLKR